MHHLVEPSFIRLVCLCACLTTAVSAAYARQSLPAESTASASDTNTPSPATTGAATASPAVGADTAPAQPTSAASTTPPATKPPLFNRANEPLPKWLRLRGEFRERMEGFDGGGFTDDRDDLYWLTRFRITATATPAKTLSFVAQVQDARVLKKSIGPTGAPFRAPFDLRMAYADLGAATGPLTVRLGRQELVYGEQRLVGHVSWLNAARTFDGVKLTLRRKAFQVDAFATSVVRILEDGFDRSGNGNRFVGAYATTNRLVPRAAVEPYVFWRRDVGLRAETGTPGNLGQTTAGIRLAGRLPAQFDYGVEMALQRGSLGSDAMEAWAGHWQLRKSLAVRGAVKITGEYNYASGDEDPADGTRGTFDHLYPTPHDKYGLADQVGWKNVHHLRSGVEFSPVRATPVTVNYHSWWLAERRDGIYTAGGAPLARVIAGAASRHVGQELDVQAARMLSPQIQLAGGYAHIVTGGFLEEATPGASYSHPYLMVTYVFLAEK